MMRQKIKRLMTIDIIEKSQRGDRDATLKLIEKFNPLLRKYAFRLYYEDAYNDLLADFIELMHNIQLDHIRDKGEGSMVSYICKSIRSSFVKKLTAIRILHSFIFYSELSDNELYYVDVLSSTRDEYFKYDLSDAYSILTKSEMSIVRMIYFSGYTISETAFIHGISRQAVNQMKKRALKKLEIMFLDKPDREVKV